jgi:hypothetical protein
MERIGFSTGSLARGDFHAALSMLSGHPGAAVELSALRFDELAPLMHAVPYLDLAAYDYVSIHAPGAFTAAEEAEVVRLLLPAARRGWHVILHPDTIHDARRWRAFGDRLCIENMDPRKRGRTVDELSPVFDALPSASFCFDVAHARRCDPSMAEALRLLAAFGHRLAEVHVSELNEASRHVRLTRAGIRAFQDIADHVPARVPLIIESPVREDEMPAETLATLEALGRLPIHC